MRRSGWICIGLTLAAIALVAVQWPEIERYRRLRAM